MFIRFGCSMPVCSSTDDSHPEAVKWTHKRPLVDEPRPLDVLCGKSRQCISHQGTRIFRHVIEQYRVKYQEATNKQERMDITKEIVSSMGRNARFLKFNPVLQSWEVSIELFCRQCKWTCCTNVVV